MDVAIVGIGIHRFGRTDGVTGLEQGVYAAREALADAGVSLLQGPVYAEAVSGEDVFENLATGGWMIEPATGRASRAKRRTVLRKIHIKDFVFSSDQIISVTGDGRLDFHEAMMSNISCTGASTPVRLEGPSTVVVNKTTVLGCECDQTAFLVFPAQQGLVADRTAGLDVDDRLVVNREVAV